MTGYLKVSVPDLAVAEIERATLQVVVPDELIGLPGWLVPVFAGTVGRARSAVPLQHAPPELAVIDQVADHYRTRGFQPSFRLPDLPVFGPMQAALRARGFAPRQPTLTLTGSVNTLLALHPGPPADIDSAADAAWTGMFLGPGLDPEDGASRLLALARGLETQFFSLREGGQTLACGAAGLALGWLSVHGMRTALAHRGQGLAQRVLLAMAGEAHRRGIDRVFLQVDASNAPALALYRRAGFNLAWPYAYWQPIKPD
ncbi:GNAT family N-acetyltransferase [Hydrogenophaga sp. PAMC20947]|uniref:GNAT family N-acetyltransferase n=1 Tax=Hydrogenophaga sp. PAMC20947 TaxID=2565558 RepID=UPI0014478B71|nr:GNAT family N-acetyltransferase [Hydrogenophaga sp. PAMC20947]